VKLANKLNALSLARFLFLANSQLKQGGTTGDLNSTLSSLLVKAIPPGTRAFFVIRSANGNHYSVIGNQ